MASKEQFDKFFASDAFGVAGASANRDKYGNKVLRVYQQHGLRVIPINPREKEIEGIPCVANVMDLPPEVKSISVITPPEVTEQIVDLAVRKGITSIWMQPGAENPTAVERCHVHKINVIADGSCILVKLGYSEH
jgi:predicted CoA-binding protein